MAISLFRPTRSWRAATLAVTSVACVGVMTGCGSDDKSDSASTGSTSTAAAPASTGTKPTGTHTIGILGNTFTSELLKRMADDEEATAKALGWKTVVIDGQASPDGWNQGFQRLLGEKVDVILTGAIEAAPIQASLTAAKKAKVPVISAGLDVFPDSAKQMTVVGVDTAGLGTKTADVIAEKFPGESVLTDDVSPVWAGHGFHEAATKELKAKGTEVVGDFDIDLTDLVGSLSKGSAAQAQAHPKAKVYMSCCDFAPPILATSLQGINRTDINIVSRYAVPSTLKLIKAGAPVTVVVPDIDALIFKTFDRLLAHLADGKPLDESDYINSGETQVVDKDNPTDPFPFEAGLQRQLAVWGKTYKIAGR